MFRRILIFLLITLINSSINSQIWVKQNAVWHFKYSTGTGTSGGYLKIEYIKDTILNSKVSKMFLTTMYEYAFDQNNALQLINSSIIDSNYTWNNNDTIFYWKNNNFEILYDFTKSNNESWILSTVENNANNCSGISTVEVINKDLINFNGIEYTTFDLFSNDTSNFKLRGKYNSRFGAFSNSYNPYNLIFPTYTFSCDSSLIYEPSMFKFICFEDDDLFYYPDGDDCKNLINHVGLNELELKLVNFFPNPTDGIINIESLNGATKLSVFDLKGNLINECKLNKDIKSIQLDLDKGFYIIKVIYTNKSESFNRLIIN